MLRTLLLFALMGLGGSYISHAQIVARQGDATASDTETFKSPMILELKLTGFDKIGWDSGKVFNEVRKYICDDAVFKSLRVAKKRGPKSANGPTVALGIDAIVSVLPSRDRLIQLRFEMVQDSIVKARTQIPELDVEEGYNVAGKAQIVMPEAEFKALFQDDQVPILRITMSVRNND